MPLCTVYFRCTVWEADVRVIYELRNKCYNYDILMLPDLRQAFSRIPRNTDGSQLVTDFVLKTMTTVVIVLHRFMCPYSLMKDPMYFQSENTLFKKYYDPTLMNTVLTEADKHFGVKTFFGCAYQLLLDIREWFATNKDLLYQLLIQFMRKDLSKVEIQNMTEEESKSDALKNTVRVTACAAYAAGWIKLIDNMVNQDIVQFVKKL